MPKSRHDALLACLLGVIATPCNGASTGELRTRCTDAAVYENIPPDKAGAYINACLKRLEKGGPARGQVENSNDRRAPVGFDEDVGS